MPGERQPGRGEVTDKNEEGRSRGRASGVGAGGEAAGSTEEPLCGLEPRPEGSALHLPPTGPPEAG